MAVSRERGIQNFIRNKKIVVNIPTTTSCETVKVHIDPYVVIYVHAFQIFYGKSTYLYNSSSTLRHCTIPTTTTYPQQNLVTPIKQIRSPRLFFIFFMTKLVRIERMISFET